MTLPLSLGGQVAAAERAVELVDAVERAPNRPSQRASVLEVFERWEDRPDTALGEQLDAVLDAIARLARIFDEPHVDRGAALLNEILAEVAEPPRLVQEPGWGWHIHVDASDADWPTWLLASSAMAFAALLAEHNQLPWGRCLEDDCRRPFLDRGRRSPQQYCSSTCASRARVRRHRARR